MNWFFWRKKYQRIVWLEVHIALYERQMAAVEAIGEKWCLHPKYSPKRQDRKLRLVQ